LPGRSFGATWRLVCGQVLWSNLAAVSGESSAEHGRPFAGQVQLSGQFLGHLSGQSFGPPVGPSTLLFADSVKSFVFFQCFTALVFLVLWCSGSLGVSGSSRDTKAVLTKGKAVL
jgi:hypothetical protein